MNTNHSDIPQATPATRKSYSKEEYRSAIDFVMFLYDLWCKRNKDAIMIVDKTFYENEEPTGVN